MKTFIIFGLFLMIAMASSLPYADHHIGHGGGQGQGGHGGSQGQGGYDGNQGHGHGGHGTFGGGPGGGFGPGQGHGQGHGGYKTHGY